MKVKFLNPPKRRSWGCYCFNPLKKLKVSGGWNIPWFSPLFPKRCLFVMKILKGQGREPKRVVVWKMWKAWPFPMRKGVEVRLGPGDLKRRFWLVVSNIFLIFNPYLGNDTIWLLTIFFQMGWNHQLALIFFRWQFCNFWEFCGTLIAY